MKSARIIAQEIAEILKGDVVAAAQVKEHFAEGELMTLLGLTDTAAAARIAELEQDIDNMKSAVDKYVSNSQEDAENLASEIRELSR